MRQFNTEPTLLEIKFIALSFWVRVLGISLAAVSGVLCYTSVYLGRVWSVFSHIYLGTAIVGLTLFAISLAINRTILRYGGSEGDFLSTHKILQPSDRK